MKHDPFVNDDTAPADQPAGESARPAGPADRAVAVPELSREPAFLAIPGVATWDWLVDEGSCLLSPEWYAFLGDEDMGDRAMDPWTWWQRVHEEDMAEMQNAVHSLLEGRTDSFDISFRILRSDGGWAWLLSRAAVRQKRNGIPVHIRGVVLDISRLRCDAKFQQGGPGVGDVTYHAMLENSPDLVVRMDQELFPLYMNPKVKDLMGRGREEFTHSDSLQDLRLEESQLNFLKRSVGRVFKEGEAFREPVTFRSPATGLMVSGEYSFWPEYDASGRICSAMSLYRDLTEQARLAERARLNEQRLADLYHLTQMEQDDEEAVLTFVMDSLMRLTRSSSAFIYIPDHDISGKGRLYWSTDRHRKARAETLRCDHLPADLICLTTEEDGSRNYRGMRNGDGVHPVHTSFDGAMPVLRSLTAPAMERERVTCLAGVCDKASDYEEDDLQQLETFINGAWLVLMRRRFVRELARARDAAQHASKVKDEFLANVSHELRTPLNGLLSMLQLLDGGRLDKEEQGYVRVALQSGKTLLRIISDILDYSRMESGRMQLECEAFDFQAVIRSTISLFSGEAERKNLRLLDSIDPAIPSRLIGDEARVRQVLFNLLGNALKFTEQGEIRVICSRLPASADGRVRVYMSVTDTGIGIARDKQTLIFDPFIQADNSLTRKYGGTGLGLGIVKRLVGMMHGSVSVESDVGEGAAIHCSLVFDPVPEKGGPGAPAPDSRSGFPQAGPDQRAPLDILVAEDDEVGRFAIRAFIQRAGHRPLCVDNGVQALEALRLYPFDCVLTDIQMPDMDGMELVDRVRSGHTRGVTPTAAIRRQVEAAFPGAELGRPSARDIPIVAVSAHAMSGDSERFLRMGIDHYIAKPVIMSRLLEVLEAVRRRV